MSGKPRGGDRGLCGAVVLGGKYARADQSLVKRRAAARTGGKHVVGEVGDVGAEECAGLERRMLACRQEVSGERTVERIGDIGRGGGAVAEGAEEEFDVHDGRCLILRAEQILAVAVLADAVAVALLIGIGGVGREPCGDVDKGIGGGAGEGGVLFAEETNEHDDRLGAGGRFLKVVAAAEAGVRAAEEPERFERGGNGVVVRRVREGEVIAAAVVDHGSLGRAGEQGGGVLRDQTAVVDGNGASACKLPAVGHVHNGAGGESDSQLAGKGKDLRSRDAGENVALLDARFSEQGGIIRAGVGLSGRDGSAPARLGVVQKGGIGRSDGLVDPRLGLRAEYALQKIQRNERVARVAADRGGIADKERGGQAEGEKGSSFFHGGSFILRRIAW